MVSVWDIQVEISILLLMATDQGDWVFSVECKRCIQSHNKGFSFTGDSKTATVDMAKQEKLSSFSHTEIFRQHAGHSFPFIESSKRYQASKLPRLQRITPASHKLQK